MVCHTAMDVSADLTELGRTPVAVVSAGVKSILDIEKTLEYLVSKLKPTLCQIYLSAVSHNLPCPNAITRVETSGARSNVFQRCRSPELPYWDQCSIYIYIRFFSQETQGVCVATYGETLDFPAFFTNNSGCQAPYNVTSPRQAARLVGTNNISLPSAYGLTILFDRI